MLIRQFHFYVCIKFSCIISVRICTDGFTKFVVAELEINIMY